MSDIVQLGLRRAVRVFECRPVAWPAAAVVLTAVMQAFHGSALLCCWRQI
jgi:hypothetical protein